MEGSIMALNKKLVQLREEHSLTQFEIAERINVSRQAVSKWERGTSVPSMDNLLSLSKLYGVSIDYLIDEACPTTDSVDGKTNFSHRLVTHRPLVVGVIVIALIAVIFLVFGHFLNSTGTVIIALFLLSEGLILFFIIGIIVKKVFANHGQSDDQD